MEAVAQKEHEWLKKFLGIWQATGEAPTGPDQPPMTWTTTETGRQIGELWIQAEGVSHMSDGDSHTMQITLGYDSRKGKFVGTWIGSMMDYLWVYEGEMSADGRALTLSASGPSMDGSGAIRPYRDVQTFIDDNHRVLTSHMQNDAGEWEQFMEVHYYRQ
ncbi:MAG: DUF1579 domain-containing protein [Moraxellaceae bacterium]|nr:DUF1579 domain-containing protein [Moraxellaceae bacterium]